MEELKALANEAAAVDAAATAAEIPPQPDEAAQPGQPDAGEQAQGTAELTPEQEAVILVNSAAWAAGVIWPVLKYAPETKQEAVNRLVPLLNKYNLSSEWLRRWGVEIEAGLFFGGVIAGSYMAVQAAKQAEPEAESVPWYKRIFAGIKAKTGKATATAEA